jgi:hypothetical protein
MSVSSQVERAKVGWPEILRRRFVRCPRCSEVWLVVGARDAERHVCKGCGHGFAISLSNQKVDDTPTPKGAAGSRESKFK